MTEIEVKEDQIRRDQQEIDRLREKTQHGPVGQAMVEITDLRVKIALLEHNLQNATGENISLKCENQMLKEEIQKLRSLLLQGAGTVADR